MASGLPVLALDDTHPDAGVALNAHGAHADHDDVGKFTQQVEDESVAGPAIAPLVPSTVAPPSKLLMKFARNQVPSSG